MSEEVNPVDGDMEEVVPAEEPTPEPSEEVVEIVEDVKPVKKKTPKKTAKKTTKKTPKKVVEAVKEGFPPFKGGSLGHFNAWKGAKKRWRAGEKVDINRWQ
tara:strand:- start:319 stop:621 length:303 start_codon:yes stop_codon:yes gene_type:complete